MQDMAYCRGCGKELHKSAYSCPNCGAPQTKKGLKSKGMAAVLAIFLGYFGAHRFYLKQWWGVFYVLFSWTLIPGLIAFIEGIVFLCSSNKKWDDKYNNGIASAQVGKSGQNTVMAAVVGVLGVCIGLAVHGFWLAVVLPAYSDYSIRKQLTVAVDAAREASVSLEAYMRKNGEIPETLEAAGATVSAEAQKVAIFEVHKKSGALIIIPKSSILKGDALFLVPDFMEDGRVVWRCEPDTVPARLVPANCKELQRAAQGAGEERPSSVQ